MWIRLFLAVAVPCAVWVYGRLAYDLYRVVRLIYQNTKEGMRPRATPPAGEE